MDRLTASVIVPTWNGARFLPPCLEALRAQTVRDFETIVVDNGSSDETPDVLSRYPEARVLTLPRNLGFAAAVNAGIRIARGSVVVLLNNDTEVAPNWLERLLHAFSGDPGVGMATSKIRLHGRRDVLHTTGDFVGIDGLARNRGVWEADTGQYDAQREVFGASGAAGAYRREMLEDVGRFEEAFGSYLEDVDLAWRARLKGWRCVYAPEAVVYHHLSATGGGPSASYLVARNRLWLIARNYPFGLLARNWRAVVGAQAHVAAGALRSFRGAAARATLRGLAVGLLTWPRMLGARRRIQSGRRLSDAELERLMEPPKAIDAGGPTA